jgi:hypothetical protein
MEVLGYQIAILAGVVVATLLFGQVGMWLSVAGAAIWTLVAIFTNWLLLLQFATVVVALGIAEAIRTSKNFKETQGKVWVTVVLGVGAIIWFNMKNDKQSSQPISPSTPVIRAPIEAAPPSPTNNVASSPTYVMPQEAAYSPTMQKLIARLEAEFPQFSQTSPSFNRGMVDSVIAGQDRYIAKGFSPELALEKSAREVIATSYSRPASVNQSVPAQQQGIFWECISPNGVREISRTGCRPGQRSIIRN